MNLSFLWPAAWGFAALALPVIALYLIRTRLERRQVSTFLFWDGISPQVYNQSLWRKLRRWLSLLLQLLFLTLLIIALSRPMRSGETAQAAREIIVLDASASMAAHDTETSQTRWIAALEAARQRISRLRAFDTALLIEAGESPRVLHGWSRNRRALQRALETAQPSTGQADLPAALALAGQLRGEEGSVLFITDGVWKGASAPLALSGVENVTTHWIGSGQPQNVGLTLFTARRSSAAPGEYQLLAQVHRSPGDSAPLSLELRRNGQLIDVQPLPFNDSSNSAVPWEKSWSGSSTGEVRFDATFIRPTASGSSTASSGPAAYSDALLPDDHAHVTLPALEPVTVELVSPPHTFLAAVLESLPMVEVVHVWPPENLKNLANFAEEPPSSRTLTLFHQATPPEGLKRNAIVLIAPEQAGQWGGYEGALEAPMVSDFDRESALLRYVGLDQLRLTAAGDYTPAPGAETFAESFGKPLLFGRWNADAPRWLVLGFRLEASDLVLRTAFPILMGNLVQSLQTAETGGVVRAGLPGETVTQLISQRPEDSSSESAQAIRTTQTPLFTQLSHWPFWWWAVLLGAIWLIAEWGLFSRRITE